LNIERGNESNPFLVTLGLVSLYAQKKYSVWGPPFCLPPPGRGVALPPALPEATSGDEYAGNTARFCDKVAGQRTFVLYSTDSAINLKFYT